MLKLPRWSIAVSLCVALLAVPPSGARGSVRHDTHIPLAAGAIASTTAASTPAAGTSALIVFLGPGEPPPAGHSQGDVLERELASIPTLSTGIMSATQGSYTTAQLVLDITQGARVSNSAYEPSKPPFLRLGIPGLRSSAQPVTRIAAGGRRPQAAHMRANMGTSSQVEPWPAVLARARGAPQLLDPGLLAARIPGGAGYVPAAGVEAVDGVVAADRGGHVAAVLAQPSTLRGIAALQAHHRLVVADLPIGATGYADLRALAASRPGGELLIAVQRVSERPDNTTADGAGYELLWAAFAGLSRSGNPHGVGHFKGRSQAIASGGRTLTSQTTNQDGLIASIDLAPTILDHLGLPVPADMRGRPVRTGGALDSAGLRALKARLDVITSRRLPALAWLVIAWALLLVGTRYASALEMPSAWALRVGALAIMWAPVAVLLPAALEPSRTAEFVVIVAICFALGALTDRLIPWPRAPLAPALAAVLALSVDALAGTQLLMRSLLGPDPILGARFYGIGNELKSGLAVLVFAAVAAALYPAARSRRAAATMAGAGIFLAAVEGSARIGAGVGGMILVSAGAAVATVMLLPGALDRRRILIVMGAPLLGLLALAALDLATAHGGGHFTGSVLDARSTGDIRDIIVRRYSAAWNELKNHLMPLATALALAASVVAVRRRERVCAPVASDPGWLAALAGGLTAGVIGALSEDSGPVLLVVAVFVLGCVLSYLWGKPAGSTTYGS